MNILKIHYDQTQIKTDLRLLLLIYFFTKDVTLFIVFDSTLSIFYILHYLFWRNVCSVYLLYCSDLEDIISYRARNIFTYWRTMESRFIQKGLLLFALELLRLQFDISSAHACNSAHRENDPKTTQYIGLLRCMQCKSIWFIVSVRIPHNRVRIYPASVFCVTITYTHWNTSNATALIYDYNKYGRAFS